MDTHPEARVDEVFLGNRDPQKSCPELESLQTVRYGSVAYSVDGKVLGPEYANLKPMFINKSEENRYETIMVESVRKVGRYRGSSW